MLNVYQLWLNPPVPPYYARYSIDSWRDKPGVIHWMLTGMSHAEKLVGKELIDHVLSMPVDESRERRVRNGKDLHDRMRLLSDLCRYELLYRYGGLWVDCDTELVGKGDFEDALKKSPGWRVQSKQLDRSVVFFAPRHPTKDPKFSGQPINNSPLWACKGSPMMHAISRAAQDRVRRMKKINCSIGAIVGPYWLLRQGYDRKVRYIGWPTVSTPDHQTDKTLIVARYGPRDLRERMSASSSSEMAPHFPVPDVAR